MIDDVLFLTFFENSAPTNRFLRQTEQSKFPAHLSVTTGVDMVSESNDDNVDYQYLLTHDLSHYFILDT